MFDPSRDDEALSGVQNGLFPSDLCHEFPLKHHDRLVAVRMRFQPIRRRLARPESHRRRLASARGLENVKIPRGL